MGSGSHRRCCCIDTVSPGCEECSGKTPLNYELVLSGLTLTACSCWSDALFSATPPALHWRAPEKVIINEDINNDGEGDDPYTIGYGSSCCWSGTLISPLACTACTGGTCPVDPSFELAAVLRFEAARMVLAIRAENDAVRAGCDAPTYSIYEDRANVFRGQLPIASPYSCFTERTFTNEITTCPVLHQGVDPAVATGADYDFAFATGGTATITVAKPW